MSAARDPSDTGLGDRLARALLRDAAAEAATGGRSVQPTALWRGLTRGTLSLVDCFERDGHRYFVALPAGEVEATLVALEERETVVLGGLVPGPALSDAPRGRRRAAGRRRVAARRRA
jgi:hypothetical protein